jgi:hypothetical protein
VRQTETFFERWGLFSLTFAKFIPGFSLVAPPLAGALPGASLARFLFFDTIGATLWAGTALLAGFLFRGAIDGVLDALTNLGGWALVVVAILLVLFIIAKWIERRRFYKQLRVARISVDELHDRLERGHEVVILDVRTRSAQQREPRTIPGARKISPDEIEDALSGVSADDEIVLYCT